MAGKEEGMSSSSFESTRYPSLKCCKNTCMWCSVFEKDQSDVGWKVGDSLRHCKLCFLEK